MRLYYDHFEAAGQHLRLQVHDEVLCECPTAYADTLSELMRVEMERPIPALPLPPRYGMGDHLVVLTEPKQGQRWGGMQ